MASNSIKRDHHLWTKDTIKNVSGDVVLDIAGDIILNPGGNDLKISANADGSHALNINNDGAGNFTIQANRGDANDIIFTNSSNTEICRIDGGIPAVTFGGNAVTYIAGGNDLSLSGHRNIMLTATAGGFLFTGAGATPAHAEFDNIAVGFDRIEANFGQAAITGAGGPSTDIDFRLGNKYVLELTGSIASSGSEYLSFIFPDTSGNFLLVIGQDGTGSRTIGTSAAWRAYASDTTAADNTLFANGTDTAIRWAGGVTPTLTTTADKADIISIYWDADSQTAFAVASLNF